MDADVEAGPDRRWRRSSLDGQVCGRSAVTEPKREKNTPQQRGKSVHGSPPNYHCPPVPNYHRGIGCFQATILPIVVLPQQTVRSYCDCFSVKLSLAGCSFQLGRTATFRRPHLPHFIRTRHEAISTSSA